MPKPEQQPAWKTLTRLATEVGREPVTRLLDDAARNAALRIEAPGLLLDGSKQRLRRDVLEALVSLAEAQDLPARIEQLFNGAPVNSTEQRPALHTALRAAGDAPPVAAEPVAGTRERLRRFAADVLAGRIRGFSGKPFTDVIHIGIGGSHLGPELAVEALAGINPLGLRCRFVANVDGDCLAAALTNADPHTTLLVVVSKSMKTLETRVNAESARSWFIERTGRPDALARHFVAVSADTAAAAGLGIDPDMVFPMWDWVGGRFSLWSAAGLPIALSAGPDAFDALLAGARDMDQHFRTTPLARNAPVLMAVAGIWNMNFLGAASLAVLPYAARLRRLPDYLQQLEMESNGKSVHRDGSPVGVHSTGVVWGGQGTNGQHAFHQLLHQGTRAFAADFVVVAQPRHDFDDHHAWLLANALAQSQAMMTGQDTEDPHRRVSGNKATSTIVLDRLDAYSLGALLAAYEHKVFCQGVIWDINSFDQWGVELGKRLAQPIHEQLDGASAVSQDASTRYLIDALRRR